MNMTDCVFMFGRNDANMTNGDGMLAMTSMNRILV